MTVHVEQRYVCAWWSEDAGLRAQARATSPHLWRGAASWRGHCHMRGKEKWMYIRQDNRCSLTVVCVEENLNMFPACLYSVCMGASPFRTRLKFRADCNRDIPYTLRNKCLGWPCNRKGKFEITAPSWREMGARPNLSTTLSVRELPHSTLDTQWSG
jgi:hypothetical protein